MSDSRAGEESEYLLWLRSVKFMPFYCEVRLEDEEDEF